MIHRLLIVVLYTAILSVAAAQESNENKIADINNWLSVNQIDSIIYVSDILEEEFERVRVIFSFSDKYKEIPGPAWDTLSNAFDKNGIDLEDYLAYGIQHITDLELEDQRIQIYQECFDDQTPCFNLEIYYRENTLQVLGPTVRDHEITVANETLKANIRTIVEKARNDDIRSKREFNIMVRDSLKQYFENKHKDVAVKTLKTFPNLVVKVSQIKGEVVHRWIFSPREILRFQIGINVEEENTTRVFCQVQGKYGSSLFAPSDGGYIDMLKGFKEELTEYNDNFLEEFIYSLL